MSSPIRELSGIKTSGSNEKLACKRSNPQNAQSLQNDSIPPKRICVSSENVKKPSSSEFPPNESQKQVPEKELQDNAREKFHPVNESGKNCIENCKSDARKKDKSKDSSCSCSSESAGPTSTKANSDPDDFETQFKKLAGELDKLEIQGAGGRTANFSDQSFLNQFMENQYPDWKKPGKKTSVPCVRIPDILILEQQMSNKLEKHYRSIQKGEKAERKIYRLFLNDVSNDDEGIIILPNFNGNEIFENGSHGCLEIDMIVAHPTKGIFVFNVKNEQKPKVENLKNEMRKHTDFIRYLLCYKSCTENPTGKITNLEQVSKVPIHAVFCYYGNFTPSIDELDKLSKDTDWYTEGRKNRQTELVIVFQNSQLQSFASLWKCTLQKLKNMEKTDKFDVLVSRLVALSSMKQHSSLIHHKFVSNDIQSKKVKTGDLDEWIGKQFDGCFSAENISCEPNLIKYTKALYGESKNSKTTVILWTKEQLGIIVRVFKSLTDAASSKENKPLRLNVKGAKGSGKTMLMVFLAKLAARMFQKQKTAGSCVVLYDGSGGGAKFLFSNLKHELDKSGIEFWTELDFSEKFHEMRQGIVFIDEDPMANTSMEKLMEKLCSGQSPHLVIFSSEEERPTIEKHSYKLTGVNLSQTLRSTKQIKTFSSNLIKNINTGDIMNELNGSSPHNLDGTNPPDIICVDSKTEPFITGCVEKIMTFILQDMPSILVVINFLSPKSQVNFVSLLKTEKVSLHSISYKLNIEEINNSEDRNLPKIHLESTNVIRGSEFGVVVVLLEKMVASSRAEFRKNFHMAVTRATTNLAIVVADTAFFNSLLGEDEISYAVQNL